MKIYRTPSTKVTKEHDAVETELTLDFTGLTSDDILEIAVRSAVIAWQTKVRNAGKIPAKDVYKVPKPGTRSASVPLTPEALAEKYGIEEAIRMLEALRHKEG